MAAAKHARRHLRVEVGNRIDGGGERHGKMRHGTAPSFFGITGLANKVLSIIGKQIANDALNQVPFKAIVSRWDGCVGGEQGPLGQLISGPTLTKHLEHRKGAVPFVQVHPFDVVAEGLQGMHATHAQEVFLSNRCRRRLHRDGSEANKFCRVVGMKRVEEIHGNAVP